jgi:NADH-quinone oxidoreductase subunit J
MVFSKNPVHSVLYLVVTFFAIAGHYFLVNAQFLGVVHIIVYAGAIMVLFLYVIMMLNLNKEVEPLKNITQKFIAIISAGLLSLVLIASARSTEIATAEKNVVNREEIGFVENLGKTLFNEYLLPFELASVLLLSAMVGAIFLSKKDLA